MPSTAHIAIADAIVASLKAAGVAGGRVYHVWPDASSANMDSATVRQATADPELLTCRVSNWTSFYDVFAESRCGVGSQRAHEAIGLLAASIHNRLVIADGTLGGLVGGVTPAGVSFKYDDAERASVIATLRFKVQHRTDGTL